MDRDWFIANISIRWRVLFCLIFIFVFEALLYYSGLGSTMQLGVLPKQLNSLTKGTLFYLTPFILVMQIGWFLLISDKDKMGRVNILLMSLLVISGVL